MKYVALNLQKACKRFMFEAVIPASIQPALDQHLVSSIKALGAVLENILVAHKP